jgi:hypothetical protein
MINVLRSLFAPQVRKQKYGYLDEFSLPTCIESHLTNMHRIYRRLTDKFDYEITDDFGKDVVLDTSPTYL